MKKAMLFARRNTLETVRDPILYIFCIGFPVAMLALFQLINHYTNGTTPTFLPQSLVPGVMMFSFTFVMLTMSLLVSRDKSTALLRRLYAAPLRPYQFVLGYALPAIAIGVAQAFVCVGAGALLAAITGTAYFSFGAALLLVLSQLPILLFCVFLGILFGALLNDKSAPGLTSVFITASGILGGAWMPLDTMGSFETFCRCLPFYPSVTLGRIITGATLSISDYSTMYAAPYTFDRAAALGLIPLAVFLLLAVILSFVTFRRQMKKDN